MNGSQELSLTQSYAPAANQSIGAKRQKERLSYETASKYLSYDPETGLLSRKKVAQGQKNLDPQGPHNMGYKRVSCGGGRYLAHRLIWLLYHGYWPENEIDHINNNRSDNRIVNLREVGRVCNMRNASKRSNCVTGVTGVYFGTGTGKWFSQITVSGKARTLGHFRNFDEAVCHRLAAEQCLDWSTCRAETTAAAYVKRMLNP